MSSLIGSGVANDLRSSRNLCRYSYRLCVGDDALPQEHQEGPMKVVEKPWGKEEWLVVTGKYCLKRLYINQGHRLSLQYHKVKLETMFLEEGVCDLIINAKPRLMQKDQAYTINPNEVHRLIAHSDTVILEVSTPELNDVVRLDDDYER